MERRNLIRWSGSVATLSALYLGMVVVLITIDFVQNEQAEKLIAMNYNIL